ncbi:hypothetical protein ANN_26323 [Periplaneta americana]|uniref:C2H2-type domain-containing protein n=1 Tax=Periplaneta americana TaxID=6978 RepID=A0ABQ8S613_PERAM|nr:hypothetical protein ANN_26323 [Periplaneta americana]
MPERTSDVCAMAQFFSPDISLPMEVDSKDSILFDEEDSISVIENTINQGNTQDVPCPHCGKFYKGRHGVKIHISRVHPSEQRNTIVARQTNGIRARESRNKDYLQSNISKPVEENSFLDCSNEDTDLASYKHELLMWKSEFTNISDSNIFSNKVEEFAEFLARAIHLLPEPKHPAVKHYEARRKKKLHLTQRGHKTSSNPERSSKRDRQKRKERCEYQKTLFLFYNQRRKAVRNVLNDKHEICEINTNTIYDHFSSLLSMPNNHMRHEYPCPTETAQVLSEELENTVITKQEVIDSIRGIAVDTAPGPDRVLVTILLLALRHSCCRKL